MWGCLFYTAGLLLLIQIPSLLPLVKGPVNLLSPSQLASGSFVNISIAEVVDLDTRWNDEIFDLRKLGQRATSGKVLQARLAGSNSLILIKSDERAADFTHIEGVLVSAEQAGYKLRDFEPYVLEVVNYTMVPQSLFAAACIVFCSYCLGELRQLIMIQKFPGLNPFVQSLAQYSNDGTSPQAVVGAINREIEAERVATSTIESALFVTECWIINVLSASFQVAHFGDVAHIQPLQSMDTAEFVGVQFVCRRGGNFSVRMTQQQFATVEQVLSARQEMAASVHGMAVQRQQIDRLQEAMAEATQVYHYPAAFDEIPECMTMCGNSVEIKVQRLCEECHDRRDCLCLPTMCVECMARWFKEEDHATCPTCRVEFCMKDCVPVVFPEGNLDVND